MEAYQAFPSFAGKTLPELLGWLRRILINNARNLRRRFLDCRKRSIAGEVSLDEPQTALLLGEQLKVLHVCPSETATTRRPASQSPERAAAIVSQ